ncbi:MAG: hypothetical protein HC901_04560 [Bdellovibrionaceae bacterium]|nr:hypothetical protein [Pseudobdellovibrionaceae bacterium]
MFQLGFGERAGEFGVGARPGVVEAGFEFGIDLPAEVGEDALVVLLGEVAEAVERGVGDGDVGVGGTGGPAGGGLAAVGVEAADLQAEEGGGGGVAGVGNQVDGTA